MRIDRLLFFLRFAKSRALAQAMLRKGHCRLNGQRVRRVSMDVGAGDVLTLPRGREVTVVRIEALPERRGPADEARSHYHELDEQGQSDIAADPTHRSGDRQTGMRSDRAERRSEGTQRP